MCMLYEWMLSSSPVPYLSISIPGRTMPAKSCPRVCTVEYACKNHVGTGTFDSYIRLILTSVAAILGLFIGQNHKVTIKLGLCEVLVKSFINCSFKFREK